MCSFLYYSSLRDLNYNYDADEKEMPDDQESLIGRGGVLAFPDLFAPAASRSEIDENRYLQDQSYFKDRPKAASSSSLIDSSSFNVSSYFAFPHLQTFYLPR